MGQAGLGLVQELSVSSGEPNWELTSASSEEDVAPAEGSHHAAATGLVGKILQKSSLSLFSHLPRKKKTILRARESRGTLG